MTYKTPRLTAEWLALEHMCNQRSRQEPGGEIGASTARNRIKFWTKFSNQPSSRYLIVEELVIAPSRELPQIAEQSNLQVCLAVPFWQVEQVKQLAVIEYAGSILG